MLDCETNKPIEHHASGRNCELISIERPCGDHAQSSPDVPSSTIANDQQLRVPTHLLLAGACTNELLSFAFHHRLFLAHLTKNFFYGCLVAQSIARPEQSMSLQSVQAA